MMIMLHAPDDALIKVSPEAESCPGVQGRSDRHVLLDVWSRSGFYARLGGNRAETHDS